MTALPTLRRASLGLLLGLLLAGVALAACEPSAGEPAVAAPTPEAHASAPMQEKQTPASAAAGSAAVEPVQDQGVPTDLYPDIPLGLLKPELRGALVRINKAQLCPCPQSAESLHQCMQKQAGRCELAVRATQEGMRSLHEGLSEKDSLDAVGNFIETALKVYTFDLTNTPVLGNKDAKVVIVEFADFECPFCSRARALIKAAHQKHPDKVAVYFKQFPLSFHQHSTLAATAALAAHKQGRFWEMYDLLFDNQTQLSEKKILEFAQGLGLNMDTFAKDWKSPEIQDLVQKQVKQGNDAAVNSTPTFFINGRRYVGEPSPEAFLQAVEREL